MSLGLGLGLKSGVKAINYFISTWKTDNLSTGSSANNQIKLPLESTGTYDFYVDFENNGNWIHITAYNQAEVTHTFPSAGTYTVRIRGTISGFRFNNGGDRLKLLNISKWGCLKLGNSESYFYGCNNLVIDATDRIKTDNINNLKQMFRDCIVFNSLLNIDTENIYNMQAMFYGCIAFNQSVSNFNTAKVTDMIRMFYNCAAFNQSVSNFNTANVITMERMFVGCTAFNQSVSNFNTSLVTSMAYMFYYCTNFNQDISSWDFTAVTNMQGMFTGATSWSTANYDAFLISAAAQAVKLNVTFDCNTKYTAGGAAEAARTYLIGTKLWTINDAGVA